MEGGYREPKRAGRREPRLSRSDRPPAENRRPARINAGSESTLHCTYDEGSGDTFDLDTALDPAPVVFNQHDWFDGGTGENGYVLGRTLLDFYTAWAQVCLQLPRSLWWPSVFNKSRRGVDWASAEFSALFRLPGSV